MATNPSLPSGAFLTTIGGKKCTAVPLAARNGTGTTSSLLTTTSVASTTETTSSEVTTTQTAIAQTSTTDTSTTVVSSTSVVTTTAATTATTATTAATTTTTSAQTQVTTTSTAVQSINSPADQAPVATTTTPPTQDTSTTQDVSVSSTVIATTPPQPENTPQTTQNPAAELSPPAETTATGAPIVTGTSTTSTALADPSTSVANDIGATTPDAVNPTATPTDLQSQPIKQQPTSAIAATTSTNADGVIVPPVATETTLATLPSGVPVLGGPGPGDVSNVANPVTSTNAQGEIVVAPTQPPSPGQPTISGSPQSPGSAQTISDTRPQDTALPSLGSESAMGPRAMAAIAGSVAGTFVLLGVLAFLFCWRRRKRNSRRQPASPASTERGMREKQPYVITRTSIGPTPITEKFKASLKYRYQDACLQVVELGARAAEAIGLRKRTDADRDGATAQSGPLMAGGHSRNNSGFGLPPVAAVPKREYPDWWDRLTEDEAQNWTIKPEAGSAQAGAQAAANKSNVPPSARASSNVMGASAASTQGPPPPIPVRRGPISNEGVQMSNAATTARQGQPRQAAPSDHFMSNLGLNFDAADPFSDTNTMSHVSAIVMPLSTPTGPDPFSDANAIPARPQARGPSNYVQGVQHARRESYNTAMRGQQTTSVYRESTLSEMSFQTRRNRVRSDPFDLDRPELRAAMPVDAVSRANDAKQPAAPRQAHVRNLSTSSSKYSTHTVSEAGFSEPGPDVGPAVNRKRSNGSQTSVGRAM